MVRRFVSITVTLLLALTVMLAQVSSTAAAAERHNDQLRFRNRALTG